MIKRINYRNDKRESDFEIVDIQDFFKTRSAKLLESDYRLNFWAIIYITEGLGTHFVDFIQYNYQKDHIIIIQKNQVHHFKLNSSVKGYVIHINEPFFYRLNLINEEILTGFIDRASGNPVLPCCIDKDNINKILIDLIFKEYNRGDDQYSADLTSTLFESFILSLRFNIPEKEVINSRDYTNFKRFRLEVEKHYTRIKSVEEFSKIMSLSKKSINQATRQVVGLSAKEFIINRVILEIKRCLSVGNLLNYEIADRLGFNDPANMTRFFTHYHGVSPKVFRKNLNNSIENKIN